MILRLSSDRVGGLSWSNSLTRWSAMCRLISMAMTFCWAAEQCNSTETINGKLQNGLKLNSICGELNNNKKAKARPSTQ